MRRRNRWIFTVKLLTKDGYWWAFTKCFFCKKKISFYKDNYSRTYHRTDMRQYLIDDKDRVFCCEECLEEYNELFAEE